MTHRIALIALVVAGTTGLSGCHHLRSWTTACHDTKPYQRAGSIASLKIPTGLDTPETANALHIPALNTPDPPRRKKTDPCLDEPPAFNVAKAGASPSLTVYHFAPLRLGARSAGALCRRSDLHKSL